MTSHVIFRMDACKLLSVRLVSGGWELLKRDPKDVDPSGRESWRRGRLISSLGGRSDAPTSDWGTWRVPVIIQGKLSCLYCSTRNHWWYCMLSWQIAGSRSYSIPISCALCRSIVTIFRTCVNKVLQRLVTILPLSYYPSLLGSFPWSGSLF